MFLRRITLAAAVLLLATGSAQVTQAAVNQSFMWDDWIKTAAPVKAECLAGTVAAYQGAEVTEDNWKSAGSMVLHFPGSSSPLTVSLKQVEPTSIRIWATAEREGINADDKARLPLLVKALAAKIRESCS